MVQNVKPIILNLGCGLDKIPGMINVDAYEICKPDMIVDLNKPLPWKDNSVDEILAKHVFEHLDDYWETFKECIRILKPCGRLEIHIPDESSGNALTYRDHKRIIATNSFHGIIGKTSHSNAWALSEEQKVPAIITNHFRVPFKEYNWMPKWLINFCGNHLRNFVWERIIEFTKIQTKEVVNG
jgi:ubiquinone/menaquinone biosynthesis C-methylase UbiE